jgi:hypothetical protein
MAEIALSATASSLSVRRERRRPVLRGRVFAKLPDVTAALPPGEPHHAADQIVGHVQRDRARVHEIAEVLELHERLDERLLELGTKGADGLRRRVVGQLEDLPHRPREEIGWLRRLHEGGRGLLAPLPHERHELVGGKDETPDDRGRRDQGQRDLELRRRPISPALQTFAFGSGFLEQLFAAPSVG